MCFLKSSVWSRKYCESFGNTPRYRQQNIGSRKRCERQGEIQKQKRFICLYEESHFGFQMEDGKSKETVKYGERRAFSKYRSKYCIQDTESIAEK